MDHQMTTEDSYAERRQLFKNIWETAMNIEEKDADILAKPKVIKTLRLDEVDRYGINKKKKLKLKNLRTVCNKILDFCDRQEADDQFYEQMTKPHGTPRHALDLKPKKVKNVRTKKKMKKSKSLHSPSRSPIARATTSEGKDEFSAEFASKTSRNTSPIKVRRTTRKARNKTSTNVSPNELATKGKKHSKGKKDSQGYLAQPSGLTKYKYYYYVDIKPVVRVQSPPKKVLRMHKVNIS